MTRLTPHVYEALHQAHSRTTHALDDAHHARRTAEQRLTDACAYLERLEAQHAELSAALAAHRDAVHAEETAAEPAQEPQDRRDRTSLTTDLRALTDVDQARQDQADTEHAHTRRPRQD